MNGHPDAREYLERQQQEEKAEDSNTKATDLADLAHSKWPSVQVKVAHNKKTPVDALLDIAAKSVYKRAKVEATNALPEEHRAMLVLADFDGVTD